MPDNVGTGLLLLFYYWDITPMPLVLKGQGRARHWRGMTGLLAGGRYAGLSLAGSGGDERKDDAGHH